MKKAIYSFVFIGIFSILFTGCGSSNIAQLSRDGNLPEVQKMLQSGENVNQQFHGWTALEGAASNGRKEVVAYLLANGANSVSPALISATKNTKSNSIAISKMLINAGADVNYMNNGLTAVVNAAYYGNGDLVKFLIENGADVNPQVNNNNNAFELFLYNGHKKYKSAQEIEDKYNEIVKANEDQIFYNYEFLFAAPTVNLAKKFIEFENESRKIKGYRKARTPLLEYANPKGNSFIMEAAEYPYRSEVIKYWADQCVPMFWKNRKGQTAYKIAKYNSDEEVLNTITDLMKNPPVQCQKTTNRLKKGISK